MDRNTVIGITLIFIILMVWQWMAAPTPEQLEAQKRYQDSIAMVERMADSLATAQTPGSGDSSQKIRLAELDSAAMASMAGKLGIFAPASLGEEKLYTLENDLMRVTLSNKGGTIKEVFLKNYQKSYLDSTGNEAYAPLKLLEDSKNRFDYAIPVTSAQGGMVLSSDLVFQVEQTGNTLKFVAPASNGGSFQQIYSLDEGNYLLDYQLRMEGLESSLSSSELQLNWVNYLDKLEINHQYERNYSTVFFKSPEEDPDYCSCTGEDEEALNSKIKWVSHTNQFFNATLIADNTFSSGTMATHVLDPTDQDLKKLTSTIKFDLERQSGFDMSFYVGPNEFDRLREIGYDLEDIVPFGWSIFGTINRWVIRPLFNFLSTLIGSRGIVILVLTLIVKGVLYPLTYRMIYSQSKMAALKPEMTKLKEKYKDDSQQVQVETMKMYREFGVNPLGGCLPVILQMPIWFALYRFFPASIEFRQESFLWAQDLSSYDVFARLPFEIPFYGSHVSLFTLIWVITTIIYTWYNSKLVDYSANPMMKYMQYAMPVFFIFFFNNFASGLTAYLCLSNILNVAQTMVTKNYLIDHDKILKELHKNKEKPKKKSAFQERLEAAMKEQQKIQQAKVKGKKK